jgi:anti-sigma B factor antagonist
MADNLVIETRETDDWVVLDVRGEVDLYTAPQLKDQISELAAGHKPRVAINLEGVEFMDSTAIGVLISGLKRCREAGGDLVLVAPQEPVRKVLSITGLDRVFATHDSVERATSGP